MSFQVATYFWILRQNVFMRLVGYKRATYLAHFISINFVTLVIIDSVNIKICQAKGSVVELRLFSYRNVNATDFATAEGFRIFSRGRYIFPQL
jgi:hypothetical protein